MKVTSYIYKYLVPRTLVSRFLLIIAVPVIIAQLVAIYIFYQRHWSNIINANSSTIAREVKLVAHIYDKHGIENARSKARILYMDLELDNNDLLTNHLNRNRSLTALYVALEDIIQVPTGARIIRGNSEIEIFYKVRAGTLVFKRSIKHLIHPTRYIFIVWMISLTLLLLIVSLIFSRNQIKSILSLAKAADDFVCGSNNSLHYQPSGALEVRKAGFAFLKMKNRIENYITKRTQTLAMISHDLKTPLTRINLQLEMLDDGSEEIADMKQDVSSMSHMINSYLDFARGETGEKPSQVKLLDWLKNSMNLASYKNLEVIFHEKSHNPPIMIKFLAFKRAIGNLLGNANKHATKAIISVYIEEDSAIIDIEDNGEGIEDAMKQHVFTPFYRADAARNVGDDANVGLGLTITNEIILSHNGKILLLDGDRLKGLKVRIILPLELE